tara:strand:+ start:261 stop:680 length:420 start_codon:yes stop_codon:yes gene_type:complete
MNQRDEHLLSLRPEIPSALISENMSSDEQFQNKTLRPVAKLQDLLFVEVFRNYIQKHKNTFYGFTIEKRMLFIANAIQRDIKFRNSLKGIMIGQFTMEEYALYIQNSSALNKRMMNIVKERLFSNIQLLEDQGPYQQAQ